MGFYGSYDPTKSVKAMKEVVVLRIRLQSHQVHLTMLQYYNMQYTLIHKIHIYIHKNESKHSEMGPVRQNPIQRTVRSVHYVCALHCAQLLHTTMHITDLIIFPLTLQTITIAPTMSIWGKKWFTTDSKNLDNYFQKSKWSKLVHTGNTNELTSLLSTTTIVHVCSRMNSKSWLLSTSFLTTLTTRWYTGCVGGTTRSLLFSNSCQPSSCKSCHF